VIDSFARFELGLGYAFTGLDLVSPRDKLFFGVLHRFGTDTSKSQ
jgi:hypothetical protein